MEQENKIARSTKRLYEVYNLPTELGPTGVTCTVPGWTLGDFTRTGKLGYWNISRLMEINRFMQFGPIEESIDKSEPNVIDSNDPKNSDVTHNKVIGVVGAQKTKLTKQIHELSKLDSPMLYTMKLGYIGKTSFSIIVELVHKETGFLLAINERQLIFIDGKTRKPTAIPPSIARYKEKYPPTGFVVDFVSRPKDQSHYFTMMAKIHASDLDNLYHTNQSIYYRFSLDAAYEAQKVGFLKNFKKDICEYDVKETCGKHRVEAFAGDEISISVWEDNDDKMSLNVEIRKAKNDALVMYQTIKFYPMYDAKL